MEIANVLDLKPGVKLSIDSEEASQKVHKNTHSLPSDRNKDNCDRIYGMMFDSIDTNSDGRILQDEFTAFLFKGLAPWPDITDIKVFEVARLSFAILDYDQGGSISREEFLATFNYICGMKEMARDCQLLVCSIALNRLRD